MEKRSIKIGVEKTNSIEDFPGKIIPGRNGANIMITSLDKVINCVLSK